MVEIERIWLLFIDNGSYTVSLKGLIITHIATVYSQWGAPSLVNRLDHKACGRCSRSIVAPSLCETGSLRRV